MSPSSAGAKLLLCRTYGVNINVWLCVRVLPHLPEI